MDIILNKNDVVTMLVIEAGVLSLRWGKQSRISGAINGYSVSESALMQVRMFGNEFSANVPYMCIEHLFDSYDKFIEYVEYAIHSVSGSKASTEIIVQTGDMDDVDMQGIYENLKRSTGVDINY